MNEIQIAVNLIPEKNILPEKLESLSNSIKKKLTPKTLNVSFPEHEKKKSEQKKETDEDKIKKYSDKLLKNISSWPALFVRGCVLLKKEKENAQKPIL